MSDRFQLIDQNIFLSLLAESAVNTPYVLTADFVGARLNSSMPPFPDVNRTADSMVGDGSERAEKLRRGWLIPIQISLGGLLNSETAARLGTRALGGTRTPGLEISVGSGVFDVTTIMQTKAQGRLPKLTTLGYDLGGYKFVHPSLAVSNFEIAFEGENDVTFSANLTNTGLYKMNLLQAALEANGFSTDMATAIKIGAALIVPPAPPEHHLMHPAATKVTFSNGATIDFAADGDLVSGACSLDNQIVVKQRPGDPFLVATDRKKGAYARDIHRGSRLPGARLKVAMDSTLKAFVISQNGDEITSLTYLFRSEDKIGATAYFYEYEWKCPLAEIQTVTGDPDGDDAAVSMNFYPKTDAVTGGYWIQRVRTDDDEIQ